MCVRCWFQADLKGSHPDSTSGRLGERWREARTEHETDRKQIGPEPVAINHHRRARPSHSSHTHATHRRTFTHTNMHSRKWNVATQVKSPMANTPGNRREKNHSSYFFFFLPPPPPLPNTISVFKGTLFVRAQAGSGRQKTQAHTSKHARTQVCRTMRACGSRGRVGFYYERLQRRQSYKWTVCDTFTYFSALCYIMQQNFKVHRSCWTWFESNKTEITSTLWTPTYWHLC